MMTILAVLYPRNSDPIHNPAEHEDKKSDRKNNKHNWPDFFTDRGRLKQLEGERTLYFLTLRLKRIASFYIW